MYKNDSNIIYMDYMSTTPIAPEVVDAMIPYLRSNFGNSGSKNSLGYTAKEAIEIARKQVSDAVGAEPEQIIFTSGATESINLAIKGSADFYAHSGKHIITLTTEHAATLAACRYLEKKNFKITFLEPDSHGILSSKKLASALTPETTLISVCHVNNEIGVIQDVADLVKVAEQNGALLHLDAAQSVGKTRLNLVESKVAMASLSAHKCYGPKGIGALYLRNNPKVHLTPNQHGGGQEQKLRSGTLPTHQIVGMGAAYELAHKNFSENIKHIRKLSEELRQGLSNIPEVQFNGHDRKRVPHNLNVTFNNIPGDMLLNCLSSKMALSSGSACNSHEITISHVLNEIGLTRDQANATIRYSLGNYTSKVDIERAINLTIETVRKLRELV
ncbi:MAG: aminotransferase class V-fold PLP-dependent enzyme [Pseudomonadota bacterium]|nr:aminotransferase class V-fold PLP-dependent enzyme [Pseudomonadota bacterium]